MNAAAVNGTWVLLQNCELGLGLMNEMEASGCLFLRSFSSRTLRLLLLPFFRENLPPGNAQGPRPWKKSIRIVEALNESMRECNSSFWFRRKVSQCSGTWFALSINALLLAAACGSAGLVREAERRHGPWLQAVHHGPAQRRVPAWVAANVYQGLCWKLEGGKTSVACRRALPRTIDGHSRYTRYRIMCHRLTYKRAVKKSKDTATPVHVLQSVPSRVSHGQLHMRPRCLHKRCYSTGVLPFFETQVTNEPPAGLKAGILRSYTVIVDQERLERVETAQWRQLLFALCFLHSVVRRGKRVL